MNEKIVEMAEREEVPKITGYFIGGVSPLGTHRPLPVVMESSILSLPEIAVSAGQWGCQAVLRPRDLLSALGARASVASFAQPRIRFLSGFLLDDLVKSHPNDGFVKSSRCKARKN